MSMAKILVVDDEPFNLDIVAEYLDGMDFELVMVESGEAAWAELEQPDSTFDLVLLDLCMPEMSGLDVLRMLRQAKLDVAVVAAAGNSSSKSGVSALSSFEADT